MKNICIFCIPFVALLFACNESLETDIYTYTPQAYHEHSFIQNTKLHAEPGGIYLVNLEHNNIPIDSMHIYDSGEIGNDIIPYHYFEEAIHTFIIDDNSFFQIEMRDINDNVIFTLTPEENSKEIQIPEGKYFLHLFSNLNYDESNSIIHQSVFIQKLNNSEGINNKKDETQYDFNDYMTLLSTNSCTHGDLSKMQMENHKFNKSNCSYSNFRGADLKLMKSSSSNFSHCNFSYAVLTNATISSSNFSNSNMYNIDLRYSSFSGSDLSKNDITKANLGDCIFSSCDFTDADFTGASLKYTTFRDCTFKNTTGPKGESNWHGQ